MSLNKQFVNYDAYFADQAGGQLDISYYRGAPYQRGYGFFSSLKRYAFPVLKYLARQGLYAGRDILGDVISGQKFSSAAKSNLKKRAASTFKDVGEAMEQAGSGLRRKPRIIKRRKRKAKVSSKSKVKRKRRPKTKKRVSKIRRSDIFK